MPQSKSSPILVAAVAALIASTSVAEDSFQWPDGAQAAVCLTYDDALESQLDIAFPHLQLSDLRATFFVQGEAGPLHARQAEWVQLGKSGHELASHSTFHPCRRGLPGRDWVRAAYDLDTYTLDRMEAELNVTNSLLHALDGNELRTYAYPCGEHLLDDGQTSYKHLAAEKFFAARGTGSKLDPVNEISFYETPCFDGADKSADDCIAYIEDAYEMGTLAVFMFHGVGGDYLTIDAEEHRKLAEYLDANRDRIWVAPYLEVMQHVKSEYERLGWPIQN